MPSKELTRFQNSLERLDRTRVRMETVFSAGQIRKIDIESVYEALFLRAVTSFEAHLETLFIKMLMGKTSHPAARAKSLIKVKFESDLIRILSKNEKYMMWLPYDNTRNRARIYLKEGRPFTDLTIGEQSTLADITKIRNAIAHKSDFASTSFKKIIDNLQLLSGEKTPAGFLRSIARSNPRQQRFEIYVAELGGIAGKLD